MIRWRSKLLPLCAALALAGCGGRDEVWETDALAGDAFGLTGAAAVLDPAANRVILLGVGPDQTLVTASERVGENAAKGATTPGGDELLVLSRGIVPRERADD